MSPSQQRAIASLATDLVQTMIAKALAGVAFSRGQAPKSRAEAVAGVALWNELARQEDEARAKLQRAVQAVASGDLESQLAATIDMVAP